MHTQVRGLTLKYQTFVNTGVKLHHRCAHGSVGVNWQILHPIHLMWMSLILLKMERESWRKFANSPFYFPSQLLCINPSIPDPLAPVPKCHRYINRRTTCHERDKEKGKKVNETKNGEKSRGRGSRMHNACTKPLAKSITTYIKILIIPTWLFIRISPVLHYCLTAVSCCLCCFILTLCLISRWNIHVQLRERYVTYHKFHAIWTDIQKYTLFSWNLFTFKYS